MSVSNLNPLHDWLKEVEPHRRKHVLDKISKTLLEFHLGEDEIKLAFNQLSRRCLLYLKRCDQKENINWKRGNEDVSPVTASSHVLHLSKIANVNSCQVPHLTKIDESLMKIEVDEICTKEEENVSFSHQSRELKVEPMDNGFISTIDRIEPEFCNLLQSKVNIKSEVSIENDEKGFVTDLNSGSLIPNVENIDLASKIVESNEFVGTIKVRDPTFLGIGCCEEPMIIDQTLVSSKQSDTKTTQLILHHNNSTGKEYERNTRHYPTVSQNSTKFVNSNCDMNGILSCTLQQITSNGVDTGSTVAQSQSLPNGNYQKRELTDAFPPFSRMGSSNSGTADHKAYQIPRPQKIACCDSNGYLSIQNEGMTENFVIKDSNSHLKKKIIRKPSNSILRNSIPRNSENSVLIDKARTPEAQGAFLSHDCLPTTSASNNRYEVNSLMDQRHWVHNLVEESAPKTAIIEPSKNIVNTCHFEFEPEEINEQLLSSGILDLGDLNPKKDLCRKSSRLPKRRLLCTDMDCLKLNKRKPACRDLNPKKDLRRKNSRLPKRRSLSADMDCPKLNKGKPARGDLNPKKDLRLENSRLPKRSLLSADMDCLKFNQGKPTRGDLNPNLLHNYAESMRRLELKILFDNLRLLLPDLRNKVSCSQISILQSARNYCTELKNQRNQLSTEVSALEKENERLYTTYLDLRARLCFSLLA